MWLENLATLVSAWLFFLVMNAGDLKTLVKQEDQRTQEEQLQIKRGLFRILCLEILVLVPASAGLLVLIMPFLTQTVDALAALAAGTQRERVALHALVGIVSYGFPFGALRERISNAMQGALSAPEPKPRGAVHAGAEVTVENK